MHLIIGWVSFCFVVRKNVGENFGGRSLKKRKEEVEE
jgi:hypothetical protein